MPKITNKTYDALQWIAQVFLPATGTLYAALGAIWDLGGVQQVSGSILAVDTFLGVLLGLSNAAYKKSDDAYDGTVDVKVDDAGKKTFMMNLNGDPNELDQQKSVSFKVNAKPAPAPTT